MTTSQRVLLEQLQERIRNGIEICERSGITAISVSYEQLKVLAALLRALPQTAEPIEETIMEKPLSGLWRNDSATPEGKYLVKRRDGTVVEWPNFVIGAKDPAAPAALRAYAHAAEKAGMNARFVQDVLIMAEEFEQYRLTHGAGDPDRGRHREDDPATIAEMRHGHSA